MKCISNYREMTENEKDRPIRELIEYDYPDETKKLISEHFEQYHEVDVCLACFAVDRIKGENLKSSILVYTDGVYRWTNEEIYHFEKYGLRLNDDFISYVLKTK